MIRQLLTRFAAAVCCWLLWSTGTVAGFAVVPESLRAAARSAAPADRTGLRMGWMDAFKNDPTLGKAPNAGLTNGPNVNDNVTVNGKAVPGAVVGQKLTVVAGRVRVRIPVNCQKGDCGTCMVNLNGRKVKACQTPLPAGKAVIQTL